MYKKTIIKPNTYYDSVTLMSLGSKIKAVEGVKEAVVVMATDMNKEILMNVGLGNDETEGATQNDLIIAVEARDEETCVEAHRMILDKLTKGSGVAGQEAEVEYKTIRHAVKDNRAANVAVISVPGRYAAREAKIALNSGLHVMMFSDNVSIEEERALKELAVSKGLLMMGPDCGTAVINHTGLCFANQVRRGNIGVVGASGTGLQEVIVQIDRLGGGITQALGTGGRDLSREIGGLMMLHGIRALAKEPDTEIIVLVSKPPEQSVADKIFELLNTLEKPVVVCFLEGDTARECREGVYLCDNLLDAARTAVQLAGVAQDAGREEARAARLQEEIARARELLQPGQRSVRGLFCGGTLCAEALFVLRGRLGKIRSNVSHRDGEKIDGKEACRGSVLLDLGDDEFTNGRPHPMIEPSLRNGKIAEQGDDPEVGVILLDFELGYGSHGDPAGETVPAIREARARARAQGRELAVVGYICGTAADKQDLSGQRAALLAEGVILAESNVEAAQTAADILL